jgi:hypothetical protein
MLVPLTLILAVRVYRSRRIARPGGGHAAGRGPTPTCQGLDSDFYRVEALLARRGLVRPRPVPPRAWLRALERDGLLPAGSEGWEEVIELHYRARFGPRGLDPQERDRLRRAARRWAVVLGASADRPRR